MAAKRDYYEVLGVTRTANDGEIKKAYRKVAMECHPDRHPGDKTAEERFKEAAEAYEVLSDGDKRAHYDRFGHEGLRQQGFSGFSGVDDIFSQFGDLFDGLFGGRGGGRGRRAGGERGADLRVAVQLTFPEAVAGVAKEIDVKRPVPCTTCSGSGAKPGTQPQRCGTCNGRGQVMHSQGFFMIGTTCPQCHGQGVIITAKCDDCLGNGAIVKHETLSVNIPAGVDDGRTLRVTGKGEAGRGGGPNGNLYVVLHVAEDERFHRDGADVLTEVTIPFTIAAMGGTVTVPTLEDGATGTTELEIEAGTQPDTVLVRRGEGMQRLDGYGKGDHAVQLKIEVPKTLTARQKELLKEFAAEAGEACGDGKRGGGFFGSKRKRK
jgi:molecular chaperone DnaJ